MKCIPPASICCYCSCFSCFALHGFTLHCHQQFYTTLLYSTSSFNAIPEDRLGCPRWHISGSERFSNASSAAFQPFHVFSMTKSPQGGLPYFISILWMGWGGFYLNTFIYKSKEYVWRSNTLLLDYKYTYLIFVIFGLQATALFRPEKVRTKMRNVATNIA